MKKMNLTFSVAGFSVIVMLLAAGCSLGVKENNNGTPNNGGSTTGGSTSSGSGDSSEVARVTAKDLLAPDEYVPSARSIAQGANDFAFRFAATLAADAGNNNFVCSPYSVWLPLAALVNATKESKKGALLSTLGAAGMSEGDINTAASRMLYGLTNVRETKDALEYYGEKYNNPLKIANAIFVKKELTLQDSFAQTFMDFYRGTSIKVNFTSGDAAADINKWASDNTEGLIDNVVMATDFNQNTVAAIANAIYFSDRWGREFDSEKTSEDVFHSPAGNTQAFYMLREGENLTYYEDDQVQAMPLAFTSHAGMYIILPKDGDALGLLSSMTADYFEEIQNNSIPATGKLLLPRFSIEGDRMDLEDTLIALGVPLFEEGSITGLIKENTLPIGLTKAVQKALIRVDEKGTTAAAVTVLAMEATSNFDDRPQPEPFEMICNKPFVFVLYDYTRVGGEQVLFTGMVNNP
jgi:serpin B